MSVVPPLAPLTRGAPHTKTPPAPEDLTVRPERRSDTAAIRSVHTAAFGHELEAVLVDALRDGPSWNPALSLVAELSSEVVGHVLVSDVVCAGRPVLALAPLAVRPDSQRQGIGTALVAAAVEAARATDRGLLLVLGDPAYYARFGFRPSSELGITNPFGASSSHYGVLPLPAYSPELRGLVEYPSPFASL